MAIDLCYGLTMQEHTKPVESKKHSIRKKLKICAIAIIAFLSLLVIWVGYVYAISPNVIRRPKLEHYHFRMQILLNGQAENFADQKYQEGYSKDQCNANLPEQPIHFHDQKDQFVHIHWEGITGGMVLKNYGWNFIGGLKTTLGYKMDKLAKPQNVHIHGNNLPKIPKDYKIYVYSGDEHSHKAREFNDFKNQDLETFFGKTSNFPAHEENKKTSILHKLFPKVYAHDGVNDGNDGEPGEETEQQKLTRINNLLGNVVIFVQKDKPTDKQIKDRFNMLAPLSESTCGG